MPEYKCLKCGEIFISPSTCAIHHLYKGCEEFQIEGSVVKITIKSPQN